MCFHDAQHSTWWIKSNVLDFNMYAVMYTDRTKHSFQSAEFTDPWCVPSRKLSLMHRGRSHGWHAACVPSGNAHPFHPGETCCVSQTWEVLWEYFSLTFPTAWTRAENTLRHLLAHKTTVMVWVNTGALPIDMDATDCTCGSQDSGHVNEVKETGKGNRPWKGKFETKTMKLWRSEYSRVCCLCHFCRISRTKTKLGDTIGEDLQKCSWQIFLLKIQSPISIGKTTCFQSHVSSCGEMVGLEINSAADYSKSSSPDTIFFL